MRFSLAVQVFWLTQAALISLGTPLSSIVWSYHEKIILENHDADVRSGLAPTCPLNLTLIFSVLLRKKRHYFIYNVTC